MMRAATVLAGVVLVLVPAVAGPRAVYPLAVVGLVCVLVIAWPRQGVDAARRAAAAVRARTARRTAETGRGLPPADRGLMPAGRGLTRAGRDAAEGARAAAGTVAAIAVIAECAVSRLGTAAMAAEGLLLLGFLLLLGRPAGLAGGAARAWLRLRMPAALAAVAATGIVLAALAAAPGSSPWLALAGLAAAAAAYLVAAPRDRSGGPRRG